MHSKYDDVIPMVGAPAYLESLPGDQRGEPCGASGA